MDNEESINRPLTTSSITPERVLGYILVSPAVVSVLLFFIALITKTDTLKNFDHFDSWIGSYGGDAGGYTSSLPIYFGLMAIAGGIFVTSSAKNKA
jgi:hypothetical protein